MSLSLNAIQTVTISHYKRPFDTCCAPCDVSVVGDTGLGLGPFG